MVDSPETIHEVAIPRMTAAEAADLLREYESELAAADLDVEYAERVRETIADLDAALD
jgi:hypothetical protein